MRKNQYLILLGACVLALVFLVVTQYLQIGALKESSGRVEELNANYETAKRRLEDLEESQRAAEAGKAQLQEANRLLQSDLEMERTKVEEARAELAKKVQDLKALAEASASAVAAPSGEDLASADPPTSSSETEGAFSGIAKMLKDPAMKEMMRSQQKMMMDMSYRSLYETLDIPEEEMETLKGLLLDKQMKQMDLGLEMMEKSLTTEERAARAEEHKNITDEIDNKIKDLLGQEDYEIYEYMEDTKGERIQINLFKQTLGSVDQLGLEQEEDLIFAMQKARTEFTFSTPMGDGQEMTDPFQMTPEATKGLLQDLRKLEDQYVVQASEILTPEQLKQFKAYLEQQRAMQEMGMKMAVEMFGGSDSKVEPPTNDPVVREVR